MLGCMRTTLTLDDDVAAALERLRKTHDAGEATQAFSYAIGVARAATRAQHRQRCRSARDCGRRSVQVILIDANILVHAHVGSMAQHEAARDWLDGQLSG